MSRELPTCRVVNDDCKAPAGWRVGGLGGSTGARTEYVPVAECASCGEPVCTASCSRRVMYRGRRRRLCADCIDDRAVSR